jgi:hypothetical protein
VRRSKAIVVSAALVVVLTGCGRQAPNPTVSPAPDPAAGPVISVGAPPGAAEAASEPDPSHASDGEEEGLTALRGRHVPAFLYLRRARLHHQRSALG